MTAPPPCAFAHVCVCMHTFMLEVEQQRRVTPLPCSHTVVFLAHVLFSGLLFIPGDNIKSSCDTYNAAIRLFITGTSKSVLNNVNSLLQYSEVAPTITIALTTYCVLNAAWELTFPESKNPYLSRSRDMLCCCSSKYTVQIKDSRTNSRVA